MPAALTRSARRPAPVAFALLCLAFAGLFLCPRAAEAAAAGYCSELALSDVAPAPVMPVRDFALASTDCGGRQGAPQWGASVPHDDGPTIPTFERVERARGCVFAWSPRREAVLIPVEAVRLRLPAGVARAVFRPPC